MAYTRQLLIIPAELKAQALELAVQLDPEGGAQMFQSALASSQTAPATHYWASALCSSSTVTALAAALSNFPGAQVLPYDARSNPTYPFQVLTSLRLVVKPQQ